MNLVVYRPIDTSSAATREALAAAERDAAALDGLISDAKHDRDTLLLDGDPAALKRAEVALAQARLDAERLQAVAEQLQALLTAALRQEKFDAVEAAKQTLSDANSALNAFVVEHGPTLAGLLATARDICDSRVVALSAHDRVQLAAVRDFVEADDADGAERVSGGTFKVMSVSPEAGLLGQLVGNSPLMRGYVDAFPALAEPG